VTPRQERYVRSALFGTAGLCLAGAAFLGAWPLVRPLSPRKLPDPERSVAVRAASFGPQELEAAARKRMSRAIVKVAPPPPPKPAVPPLDLLVRLSGIIDYGPQSAREAFIELRSSNQTKAYKPGDAMPGVGAVVKSISDEVLVEYDGKLWKLTDRGAQPAPDAVPSSGAKP
jgi:hypothetical protein